MSLFSVNTNLGALAALASLNATQQAENSAQNEVSTGQKISSAADNPAIYSIANTINASIAGLSAVSDSLNFGAQVVSTAGAAAKNVTSVLANLQQTVTSSGQSGIDLPTLQAQINSELVSINEYARTATFSGVNLLTSTADSGATSGLLNIVQSVNGGTIQIANQATALNAGATTLSDALGLTGLGVTGGTTGVQLTLNNNLTTASFAPGGGADASLQLTAGGRTYAFEFTDDSVAGGAPLQTQQNATTTIVAVHFNSTTDSTNQITGDLINAVKSSGFGVQQNTDGTLNVVGQAITGASFGSVAAGTFTAGGAAQGITSAALTGTQAALTTVATALTNINTISANLGASAQQISGIQNFTSTLSSALTAGVGALTDADLAAESARLSSLQTKQSLATQSLTIANSQPQSLLTLFKNL